MKELVCSLHIHSTYSDGSGDYPSIADAALKTDVDAIILTDHNVLVKGLEGYREGHGRQVLVLTGEEVHDQNRDPQKNHTLVIGAEKEMAHFASDPQTLINEVHKSGGITFLAHPFEFSLPMINEPDISWVAWEVEGFTGLELWNGLSEFKTVVHSIGDGLKYMYMPELMAHAPLDATLAKWDELLCSGRRVCVVGGADAHAIKIHRGIIKRTVYPYEYHFSAINNHLLIDQPMTGEVSHDKAVVYDALRRGASFIGYDLPASTRGFRFTAEDDHSEVQSGDTLTLESGATLKVSLPESAHIKLIHNGRVVQEQRNAQRLVHAISEPGYYRVECTIWFLNKERGWIYSNPIYVQDGRRRRTL